MPLFPEASELLGSLLRPTPPNRNGATSPGQRLQSASTIASWQRAIPADILQTIASCLRRIGTWKLPPNWSAADWFEEVREILSVAAWDAQSEFDQSRGVPLHAFIHQRAMSRALTHYRREWSYGLHCPSPCSRHPAPNEDYETPRRPDFDQGLRDIPAPSASGDESDDCESLGEAVAALSEQSRRLVKLLFFDDQPEREVADAFGISQPAVSQRKHAILRELRRSMDAKRSAASMNHR